MNPETAQLLDMYLSRFANRRDAYYRQWFNGADYGYTAVYEPVTPGLLYAHLSGACTLAWPALDENNCGKWICFDCDREASDLDQIQVFLEQHGWYCIREGARPGRAGHLWLLFDTCIPGKQLRILGNAILKFAGVVEQDIELFPKQAQAGKLSNPVRGPLGVHLKPGAGNCRGWFDGPEQDLQAQLVWLSEQQLNSATLAMELAHKHRPILKPVIRRSYRGNTRIDFVEYAGHNNFRQRGNEYIGPCPACRLYGYDNHGDNLSINANSGIVNCWRGCVFTDIVTALRGSRAGAA